MLSHPTGYVSDSHARFLVRSESDQSSALSRQNTAVDFFWQEAEKRWTRGLGLCFQIL